jgi:cysteinyl-tRNA synthetase
MLSKETLTAINNTYQTLGEDILGLIPESLITEAGGDILDGVIEILIQMRQEARANKAWATADMIRDKLTELGIVLEDRADGTIWKLTQ